LPQEIQLLLTDDSTIMYKCKITVITADSKVLAQKMAIQTLNTFQKYRSK